MKTLMFVCIHILLWSVGAGAGVLVSPVVFDTADAVAGQEFLVTVHNQTDNPLSVHLSWGRFDQSEEGRTVFDESQAAAAWAAELLEAPDKPMSLKAGEQVVLPFRLRLSLREAAYPAAFVHFTSGGFRSRAAVLFLLGVPQSTVPVEVEAMEEGPGFVTLTVFNNNCVHQSFSGSIAFVCSESGGVSETEIPARTLLPGRQRTITLAKEANTTAIALHSDHFAEPLRLVLE